MSRMGCHQPKRAILPKIVICITSSLALSEGIADKIPTLVANLGQVHAENDTPEHPLQSRTQKVLEIDQSVKYC